MGWNWKKDLAKVGNSLGIKPLSETLTANNLANLVTNPVGLAGNAVSRSTGGTGNWSNDVGIGGFAGDVLGGTSTEDNLKRFGLGAAVAGGAAAMPYLTGAGAATTAAEAAGGGVFSGIGDWANDVSKSTGGSGDAWADIKNSNYGGLGSLASGAASIYSGNQGAQAAQAALGEQRRQFDISQANMQPWLTAGKGALTEQQNLMGLGGDSSTALSSLVNSPGYQNRLQQGQRSQDASSAVRGGMGSGKALTAANAWGQEYASNEYNNRLNQLAGLSGTGQTTSNNLASLGAQYGSDAGNATMSAAQSRASGLQGAAKAFSDWANPAPKTKTLEELLAAYGR